MGIGKLFLRDQDGVIYEIPEDITLSDYSSALAGRLVRSDAIICDYDYEAVINDLAGSSAGNIGFVLDRLLDRDTLMPSEDAAKIIRNVPADKSSIDKLYRTFRLFSDNVPWFGEALSMLMDLEDEGDAATLAAMKFKKLTGSKQGKPGKNLSRFLGDVFKPAELAGYNQTRKKHNERLISSLLGDQGDGDDISFTKEHLLKFATFWVILSEKLSGV